MSKIIKVGSMPGKIVEVAVEVGTTIASVLEIAELDLGNKEIKVDGVVVSTEDVVTEDTKLVLLVAKVKGNGLVKIGVMPGKINEFAVEGDITIEEALEIAEINPEGYEIKVDGQVAYLSDCVREAKLILLVKKVKGN